MTESKTFDLSSTYTSLDGRGRINTHPVGPEFWQIIATNKDLLGTLIGVYPTESDWPHWEMHPDGDEMLVMIEGAMTLILEQDAGEARVPMAAGETFIIPAGTWHTALVAEPCRFLGITFGSGTQHRPL